MHETSREVIEAVRLIKPKDPEVAKDMCYKNLIGFHAVGKGIARFFEGSHAALFMAYLVGRGGEARAKNKLDHEGYFQCSIDYAEEGSGLSRKKQDSALSILCAIGLVKKKVVGRDTYRWIKLDEVGYELLSSTMAAIPYKYNITYKTLSKYAHGPIAEMLALGLEKCITNAYNNIHANVENGHSSMSDLGIDECIKRTKNKPIGNKPTWKEPREGTQVNLRDEGQNQPSSGNESAIAPLAVNTNPGAANQQAYTPANPRPNTAAYSKPKKPRAKPAPLPAHSAIPFMQELARTLAPILANQSHAAYPSEGDTAFKYHTDALANYDAIQTGAIMARTLDKPERYTDPAAWGNTYRMERAKLWAHDPATMEADLLTAARIYATTRASNTTVAKLPNVAAFLYGSTTSGGFLPWWNFIKPIEAMEAKEKAVLQKVEREEGSKPKFLEMEERRQIERDDFYHRKFVKLFGREPKQFKETTK